MSTRQTRLASMSLGPGTLWTPQRAFRTSTTERPTPQPLSTAQPSCLSRYLSTTCSSSLLGWTLLFLGTPLTLGLVLRERQVHFSIQPSKFIPSLLIKLSRLRSIAHGARGKLLIR
eukprot:Rmarinus@m.88